jgi:hypothetical protein
LFLLKNLLNKLFKSHKKIFFFFFFFLDIVKW